MRSYLVKRILLALVTVFAVCFITFFLMNLVPGGPFNAERALDEATVAALNERYNLDKPLIVQFFMYIGGLLHGDLGVSLKTGREVTDIIIQTFPVSFRIGSLAVILASICGIVLGSLAAFKNNTYIDRIIIFFSTLMTAMPSFVLASALLMWLGVGWNVAPVWTYDNSSLLLPVLSLSAYPMAYITRLTKSSMLDALNQDYIRTARAKGLPYRTILFKHALKNSLTPVITYLGPEVAYVVTGSMVVEQIFTIGGLGSQFVTAITNRDYTLIMGTTIFLAVLLVVANLIADLACKAVDPRIDFE